MAPKKQEKVKKEQSQLVAHVTPVPRSEGGCLPPLQGPPDQGASDQETPASDQETPAPDAPDAPGAHSGYQGKGDCKGNVLPLHGKGGWDNVEERQLASSSHCILSAEYERRIWMQGIEVDVVKLQDEVATIKDAMVVAGAVGREEMMIAAEKRKRGVADAAERG